MNTRNVWSRILVIVGSIAMVVGAIDPMEGSLIILPGSALVALGTFLAQSERRLIAYRVWVFILIAIGVGAMWGLTWVGGFGGNSGRSMWWGVLTLPYLIGWSMGIWGPGSPRWLLWLGIGVGLFYLALLPIVLARAGGKHQYVGVIVIGALGVLTIVGCISRLRKRTAERQ
jgi:4-amino-4-deoxy-L-arabinose transferase-like glycosyltransferase